MPDKGTRSIAGLAPERFEAGPLEVERGTIIQMTFEVDRDSALRWMPTEVTRPIPCYGRLFVVDGSGPAGPVRFGALAVGGRFRMMPRNVLVEVVAATSEGLPALAGPTRKGGVEIAREGGEVVVRLVAGDKELAVARLPVPYAIDPAMLRWDGWVVYAAQGGTTALAEAMVQVEATGAWLAKGATFAPGAEADRGSPWRQLRSLLPISACIVEGGIRIGPAAVPAPMLMG